MNGQNAANNLQVIGIALVALGIIFSGEDQVLGYVFYGAAVAIQVVSLVLRRRKR